MTSVLIEFERNAVRCESGINRPYQPGEQIIVSAPVARAYEAVGIARVIRECQVHIIPPEAKVQLVERVERLNPLKG